MREWQQEWDTEVTGRLLYAIQSVVGKQNTVNRNTSKERILTRLRIRHAGLNNTLLLIGKHPTGSCEHCQEIETVEHVILQCPEYAQEREQLNRGLRSAQLNLKNVLTVGVGSLFKFLYETGLDRRI